VDSASDGTEAVAAVMRETYDVVLMDVQMPVMDGLDATRRIREMEGSRSRVPILAVTASALPEQVVACRLAGMDGHLSKPIDRESLLAIVARLASGGTLEDLPAPMPADTLAPVLDHAALLSLAADLGPTAMVVITEFVTELRLGQEALSAQGIVSDVPRLRHLAHRMLGAARTLGARRLGKAIEALQADLHGGTDPAPALRVVLGIAAETLPEVEAALERGRAELEVTRAA
jgi:CheY-like chemotaxis protein/HPt (histidine-containing phosphotransfer) domain-containing protein